MHKVELKHIKGTGAFASKDKAKQATFREEYVLPYSFIAFHGIINEVAAKHTNLTDEDVDILLDAMWNGNKNLISRSKFGQMPRFLLKITYKESGFFIGDLEKLIKISEVENEYKIRSTKDFKLDIADLLSVIEENKDKIETVEYKIDNLLQLNSEIPKNWIKLGL